MPRIMMNVYDAPSTVAPFLLALILGVSGVAKLFNRSTASDAFISLRLPRFLLSMRAPTILPFAELILALGLLVTSGVLQLLVALATLGVFVAYFIVIARALTFNERVTCSCFGKLGLGSVDTFTAVRNAILVLLAVGATFDAAHGKSVIERWSDFSGAQWLWLLGVLVAVLLTWLISGHRGPEPTRPAATGSADSEEYVRTPIPIGRLRRPDNSTVTLRALARTEPALLLYVSPTCGSCVTVIEKAREWQHTNDVVHTYLVLPMPASNDVMGLAHPEEFSLLFDPESEMFNLFESGTPTAVLLGADGLLAGGPVVGSTAVTQLMDDILEEISGAAEEVTSTNDAVPAPEHHEPVAPETAPGAGITEANDPGTDADDDLAYVRHPTPYGLIVKRHGDKVPVISLADRAPTVLLFVSPTCGSCRSVIEQTPAWREALGSIPVAFVLQDEHQALAVEEILGSDAGETYFDTSSDLRNTFQVGTPAMVALGPDRLLLAGPVVGAASVAEAMQDIIEQVDAATTAP